MASSVRPLSSHAELLDASGDDVFIRWQVRADTPLLAWAVGDTVAFVRTRQAGRRQLTVLGAPSDAAVAVGTLLRLGVTEAENRSDGRRAASAQGITVPRGTVPLLDEGVRVGPGEDWDWMWVDRDRLPRLAPDSRVRRLDRHDEPEVSRLLDLASPRHSSDPGDPDVVSWFGVRDGAGQLVACAAHTQSVDGVPHLASIATHPSVRGQGLGSTVTGTLTVLLLDGGAPVVTLGMYADNDVARRMYDRLGYVPSHRWSSRAVVVRPSDPRQRLSEHS